jgi:hypothetical protein
VAFSSLLLFALYPHLHFTRLFTRFDVHDAGSTAHRAIFGVGLTAAATQVDRELVGLPAERALHGGRGLPGAFGHALPA